MMGKGKGINLLLVSAALITVLGSPVAAASLYEDYASATREGLEAETREMGRQLSSTFNQAIIADYQQRIDFAEYFSGFKKTLLYATKLATYGEYERDLQFARDKEVFKGLPGEDAVDGGDRVLKSRKAYVERKYERMKKSVEEEIETYVDMIQSSLDACEDKSGNDLSGMLEREESRGRIERFCDGSEYRRYLEKSKDLSLRWPELAGRIEAQLSLWQPKAPSPDAPLIDRSITGAL